MNKLNKIFILFLIIISLFFINTKVEATNLNRYDVNVEMYQNGSAKINMIWYYYDDVGTEHYIPINKEKINIHSLNVKRNGEDYNIKQGDEWDIDGDISDKRNQAAIVDNGNEYEICWGISEYGNNKFEVSYIVDGFVKQVEDAQMVHYRLLNDGLSEAPDEAFISIKKETGDFTEEELRLWSFGYEGNLELIDGEIIGASNKPLNSNNYMHVLLRFPLETFNIDNERDILPGVFEDWKEKAFDGSSFKNYGDTSNMSEEEFQNSLKKDSGILSAIFSFIFTLFIKIIFFIPFLIIPIIALSQDRIEIKSKGYEYKDQYYRDIPYNGPLDDLFALTFHVGISSYSDVTTYYLLKWIKEEVLLQKDYIDGTIFKKDKTALKIVKTPDFDTELEKKFFKFLKEAAGRDNTLQEKEFEKWMEKNSSRYESFRKDLIEISKDKLLEMGYFQTESKKKVFREVEITTLTTKGEELTAQLFKFKNYLEDFSILNEREAVNVLLWEDLMLYAALFGITEEVQRQFAQISPKYIEQTVYDPATIYVCRSYGHYVNTSYVNETSLSSSSSGGYGGSSSYGGGGGGFGGSSGGGTR